MSDFQIITICVAVVALIPATWIPLYIYRARRFDAACDTFRSAFANELAFLVSDIKPQSSIHGTTHDILTKSLNNHRHAVNVFRDALPKRKRRGFDKAWEDYLYPNGYIKDAGRPLLDYADHASCNDFETRKFAHSKISKLLEVAKPK